MLRDSQEPLTDNSDSISAKSAYSQYMTPTRVAEFMASLFSKLTPRKNIRFLDAGAGKGALTSAFLRSYTQALLTINNPTFDLFEIDNTLAKKLELNVKNVVPVLSDNIQIINSDFLELAPNLINEGIGHYSHIMLNPPYKKLYGESRYTKILQSNEINAANLYTAFMSLSIKLLDKKGELVAIIPRSFCNGFYHKKFRDFIFDNCSIEHIHLFRSRTRVFKQDKVLQENIIVLLKKDSKQKEVNISISTDDHFKDFRQESVPFSEVVHPDDVNKFIRIPIASSTTGRLAVGLSLADLGVDVSTGPIVDFRALDFLNQMPESGDVPLIYPGHLNGTTEWPKRDFRKPNAIRFCKKTEKLLFPTGFYVAIRRMSSKEEQRRIVAHLIDPKNFPGFKYLGFENHLNIIHSNKNGLSESLAYGLVGYLNSSYVNSLFHCFNGHTQVNATDLRSIKYPSLDILSYLGDWIKNEKIKCQTRIDEKIRSNIPIHE
ncbi:SAM-dependent methyltransferase [Desulfovibrio sp. PG-178-WT-4]|uniref:site-specific DNA-methyltransferase (adenine-specific) n=1 Tax=Desulfovibrio porci TaxID=2605782 RepID=A0A6L5XLD3_9BACT|nr:Eco57I restriction-modification methylase domain-containing protein [Desulfovibrio porci]MSS27992.1 SAM-dependent methyltransferase [Desulfovibrio porci]